MCRLLGMVSRVHASLEAHLGEYLTLFAELSSQHTDGWGLAVWNEQDDLVVAKELIPARSSQLFWSMVKSERVDAAVLHLRRASPGMAVSIDNTHPFVAGSAAFAHNGLFDPVAPVDDLIRELGGLPSVGTTDSERYFHLLLATMRVEDPVSAFRTTAERIDALAETVVSLNAILLTSQALYAFARSDQRATSTAEHSDGTYQMYLRRTDDTVIVASDGWQADQQGWEPLTDGTIVEVSRTDTSVTMHRGL